jgi:hypothetical protein
MSEVTTRLVWLVTRGSYSDYRVVSAFSNEASARAFCSHMTENGGSYDRDWDVESYALDEGVEQMRGGLTPWVVDVERDSGNVESVHAVEHTGAPIEESIIWRTQKEPKIPALRVYAWAADRGHAVKIAADRRAEWLAQKGVTCAR